MRNHQIECIEPLFQLFRGEGILGPNQLNINQLGAGTIKILLFQGPIFQHFTAESPYLWYRRMLEWIAPQEYTTNSTDDEAWQEPDHSERYSQIPLY